MDSQQLTREILSKLTNFDQMIDQHRPANERIDLLITIIETFSHFLWQFPGISSTLRLTVIEKIRDLLDRETISPHDQERLQHYFQRCFSTVG